MGNEIQCGPCSDLNPDMYLRGFGEIKYVPSDNKDNKVLSFYDIITDKDEVALKSKQAFMIELMGNMNTYIIKPQRIEPITSKGIWILKEYSFKIYYDNYVYNLASYARDSIKANTFVPEILILHCIACVTHALSTLKQKQIRHMNISPDTIFIDPFGNWIICPPKQGAISLLTRSLENKKLAKNADNYDFVEFLMPTEMADKVDTYDTWKADLFSLGVCVIHAIFPFKLDDMGSRLNSECIKKKLDYVKSYYSAKLFNVLGGMLKIDAKERFSLEELVEVLRDLQDGQSI